ncbi:hypothetical protein RB213_011344, partial [Colletotrichum asianum]
GRLWCYYSGESETEIPPSRPIGRTGLIDQPAHRLKRPGTAEDYIKESWDHPKTPAFAAVPVGETPALGELGKSCLCITPCDEASIPCKSTQVDGEP